MKINNIKFCHKKESDRLVRKLEEDIWLKPYGNFNLKDVAKNIRYFDSHTLEFQSLYPHYSVRDHLPYYQGDNFDNTLLKILILMHS